MNWWSKTWRWGILLGVLLLLQSIPVLAQDTGDLIDTWLLENAQKLLEARDFDRALNNYALYIALNPTEPEGYMRRSVVYRLQNALALAMDDLNQAFGYASGSPSDAARVLVMRAEIFVLMRDVDSALADYDRAIMLNPEYILAYRNRGVVYDVLENYDLAIADYSRVLDAEPDAAVFVNRARLYVLQDRLSLAINDLSGAIRLTPDDSELYIVRANLYNQLGKPFEAALDYAAWLRGIQSRSIERDPIQPETIVDLDMREGWVYRIPFEATIGKRLYVVVTSSRVDPLLVVLGPDGQPVVADDDGGRGLNVFLRDYLIEQDGTYTLLLGHARGGSNGTIRLRFELVDFGGV